MGIRMIFGRVRKPRNQRRDPAVLLELQFAPDRAHKHMDLYHSRGFLDSRKFFGVSDAEGFRKAIMVAFRERPPGRPRELASGWSITASAFFRTV